MLVGPAALPGTVATVSEGLAVAVAVVATLVVVAVLLSTVVALRAVVALRRSAEALVLEAHELRGAVEDTLERASSELARVDDLIGSAEQLTGTVGAASRLAYTGLAHPVIKVMAFTRGTTRASQRLRSRGR